jgi:hypothetical protein
MRVVPERLYGQIGRVGWAVEQVRGVVGGLAAVWAGRVSKGVESGQVGV